MTLEWDFPEKDWVGSEDHREQMKHQPQIMVKDDVIHTLFHLNDLTYPKVLKCEVES